MITVGDIIYVPDGVPDEHYSHIGTLCGGETSVLRVQESPEEIYVCSLGHSEFKTYKWSELSKNQEVLKKHHGVQRAYIKI